jgi:Arc/MetJ-type ribon-helix-helix transcriptional regulator
MIVTLSVRLEKELINEIDLLVKKGLYSSRSEFIRQAIRDKLKEMKTK